MDNYRYQLNDILSQQKFAVLNTVDGKIPYCNLVSYAITEDLKTMGFVTKTNTRKYRNIRSNNNVSFLIDNRTNQPEDIKNAIAITLIGSAIEDHENDSMLKRLLLSRHPFLTEFINEPDTAFVTVSIKEAIIAGFSFTQRIRIL